MKHSIITINRKIRVEDWNKNKGKEQKTERNIVYTNQILPITTVKSII
jgi:hypothetical protein